MEEVVNERRRAFVAAHRRDENDQAYISASRHASSVIAKAKKHSMRLALLPHLNTTLNLCTIFFILLLALLPSVLTSPTVPFPKSRLRSSPTT